MDPVDDRKIHVSSHRVDLVDQLSCDSFRDEFGIKDRV